VEVAKVITLASEQTNVRKKILEICASLSSAEGARILDVGGAAKSWLSPYVTHVMDIQEKPTEVLDNVTYVQVDINCKESWKNIPDKYFDFASCTHTLEDVRDPGFVMNELSRVAKKGFIAVPNRHQEMSLVESKSYNGFSHHRWIFNFDGSEILISPKFGPMFVPRTKRANLLEKLLNYREILLRDFRYFTLRRFVDESLENEWITKELSIISGEIECSFIWEDRIDYSYWNNDYAGQNLSELKANGLKFLRTPFAERI
jgi:ubiquinone/menaquinone biosynthesis C-methylase UbiE